MAASERQEADLTTRPGGFMAWLRRVVAGAEIERLEAHASALARELEAASRTSVEASARAKESAERVAELERRIGELDAALDGARRKNEDLQDEIDARSLTTVASTDANARVEAIERQLAQRTRELAALESTAAKHDTERRETGAKLLKAQQAADVSARKVREAEARVKQLEAKIKEEEQRAERAERAAVAARDARAARELAVRDERIAELEGRLAEALGGAADESDLVAALREREALVEELEIALVSLREAREH